MFYRRKSYVVTIEFVEEFNRHFNETNLPNQLSYGSQLIGRWMCRIDDKTSEIFAIWAYDTYEQYVEIEGNIRADRNHVKNIHDWYERHGGRETVYEKYILEVKNEEIFSTT